MSFWSFKQVRAAQQRWEQKATAAVRRGYRNVSSRGSQPSCPQNTSAATHLQCRQLSDAAVWAAKQPQPECTRSYSYQKALESKINCPASRKGQRTSAAIESGLLTILNATFRLHWYFAWDFAFVAQCIIHFSNARIKSEDNTKISQHQIWYFISFLSYLLVWINEKVCIYEQCYKSAP